MHVVQTQSVLEACRKGSRKAQMELYQLHVQSMYTSAYRILKNKELAEDIVHDSFIVSFEKIHQCQEEAHYKNWLKRIVLNRSLDELKRLKKVQFVPEEFASISDSSDEELLVETSIENLLREVNQLPEQNRIIVELFYFENLSHQEISEQLSISYENSRILLYRAKQLLKKRLENGHKQFA